MLFSGMGQSPVGQGWESSPTLPTLMPISPRELRAAPASRALLPSPLSSGATTASMASTQRALLSIRVSRDKVTPLSSAAGVSSASAMRRRLPVPAVSLNWAKFRQRVSSRRNMGALHSRLLMSRATCAAGISGISGGMACTCASMWRSASARASAVRSSGGDSSRLRMAWTTARGDSFGSRDCTRSGVVPENTTPSDSAVLSTSGRGPSSGMTTRLIGVSGSRLLASRTQSSRLSTGLTPAKLLTAPSCMSIALRSAAPACDLEPPRGVVLPLPMPGRPFTDVWLYSTADGIAWRRATTVASGSALAMK